ncbi:MAG: hypothetical protein VYA30_14400 [Myxococcota bacterium]|nr:hypothetical protein [Myxococcota bacterium]
MRSVILMAIVSGGLAGALTHFFVSPAKHIEPPTSGTVAQAQNATSSVDALVRRIHALEQRLSHIEENSEKNVGRSARTVTPPKVDPISAQKGLVRDDVRRLSQRTQQVVASAIDDLKSDDSPLRQAVSGIVQDEMKNRMAEWRAFRTARGEARDEERLDQIEKAVGLEPQQKVQLLDLLRNERSERRSLRREARETMDFKAAGLKRRELRARTDAAAADILNQEQNEAWLESRSDRRRRR